MKNKYRNELKIIKYITATERYKVIFFVSVVLSLYGGFILGGAVDNFFNSMLFPLTFPIFNVFLFAVIFFNNINVCSTFKKNFPEYILRLKNKGEYIKTMVRLSIFMYLFHLAIILAFILMCLFLTTFSNMSIELYQSYNVSNLVYLIFYYSRYIIYGLLVTVISTLIFINTDSKVTLMINGAFLVLMFYFGIAEIYKTSFSLLIWSYFTVSTYSSFLLELSSSAFMLLLLVFVTVIMYCFTIKNKRIVIS